MFYLLLVLFKPLIYLLFMPKVYGCKKALKTKGKVIFICNHISMLDPVVLALVSPRIIHFMAKKELFESKIGNFVFKALYVFPVDRGSADLKSIKNAIKLLDKGKAFGIFPEGRRMVADRMDEFEQGTSLIAMRSGAPIVPIYLRNDSFKTRARLIVGEPIYPGETALNVSRRENEQIFTQRIANRMNALKRELDSICS